MRKYAALIMLMACMLGLVACAQQQAQEKEKLSEMTAIHDNSEEFIPAENDEGVLQPPDSLPTTLATESDINSEGGYLLLGNIPDENIAIYCDNSKERNRAYIQYGEHFQAFEQKAWEDPTIFPELEWKDWDGDGNMDLIIKYLRHEGTYFDGETSQPGIVYEEVVYQWNGKSWTDIHFYAE